MKERKTKCPYCFTPLTRKYANTPEFNASYYYTEWDRCEKCHWYEFYDEFKVEVKKTGLLF